MCTANKFELDKQQCVLFRASAYCVTYSLIVFVSSACQCNNIYIYLLTFRYVFYGHLIRFHGFCFGSLCIRFSNFHCDEEILSKSVEISCKAKAQITANKKKVASDTNRKVVAVTVRKSVSQFIFFGLFNIIYVWKTS